LEKPGTQLQWPSCTTFNTAENLLVQVKEKGQIGRICTYKSHLTASFCLDLFYFILMGKYSSVNDTLSHSTVK